LYSKIFKNCQVSVGIPFQMRSSINFDTIKKVKMVESVDEEDREESAYAAGEDPGELVDKAREEADFIVKEAHLEANRILENAERQANEMRLAVEEEARKAGYETGINEARKQYEKLLQDTEYIKQQAKIEYSEALARVETDAVDTILQIARKVIGKELETNRDEILYLVRQGFEKCTNKESIVLKVADGDYEFLIQNREKLLSATEGIGELEIKKDLCLKPGACIIETPYGSIDASVQTKLDKIEEAFKQVIGR